MYESCTLGIDIGTHASKGVIVTKDGVVVGNS
jgi:sugar (pentulose or hexulose) kinase